MARRPTNTPLGVWLNSRRVGTLRREASGAIDFGYDKSWIDSERAVPVSLSLPLGTQRYSGEPVSAVFDNLLPDNEDIRKRIAERKQAGGTDSFSLLSAIGRDCVGALQFLPGDEEPRPPGTIDAKELRPAEIASMLKGLTANPLGLDRDPEFRISIAGAQEKTALLRLDGKWMLPHGTTPTTHIIKPQIGKLANGVDMSQSVENEFLCMKLVKALGVPVAEVEIGSWAGERALVVERFDRSWTKSGFLMRRPQEDCCQALGVLPTRKYEGDGGPTILNIAALLKGSDHPAADLGTLLKAQVVFWLLGATDGHAKNFSIRLHAQGYELAPLYDIVSLQPAVAANQLRRKDFRLAMSVGANGHVKIVEITPRYFAETARAAGMDAKLFPRIAADLVVNGTKVIDDVAKKLPKGFPAAIAEPIIMAAQERIQLLGRYLELEAGPGKKSRSASSRSM